MTETDASLVRAALPRGFIDRDPADIAAAEAMMAKIREVYELYGFEAVETPFIEFTEALGKFLPDQDRPNEGVFSFKDDDEQWLSLRYDLTAPLARYVAENYDRLPKPYRSYRAGWVFRNEKPGPGRFRQFMQFDADTVGAASPAADAEICMMAADCLEALGIKRGDYVIKVNNRKVLDGVMEAIGLGGDGERRAAAHSAAGDRQARPARARRRAGAARRRAQGRERRFHQGCGACAAQADQCQRYSRSSHDVGRAASRRYCAFRDGARRSRPRGGRTIRRRRLRPVTVGGEGSSELAEIADRACEPPAIGPDRIVSIPPSCAGSNITPARSSRPS